jgi:hypothetical protein
VLDAQDDLVNAAMVHDTFHHFESVRDIAVPSFVEKREQAWVAAWISNCDMDATRRRELLAALNERVRSGVGVCVRAP